MTYALKPQPFEVVKPRDDKTFQEFCCTVYGELFRDTSAKEYGRKGQRQDGLDIICRDYVHWVDGQLPKKTIVQCKQTAGSTLDYSRVSDDLEKIRALVCGPDSGFADVKRVIFATTADNCATLIKRIEQYVEMEKPPYVVEVESWDVLSRLVIENPTLSRLFVPSAVRPMSSDERTMMEAVYKDYREQNLAKARVHLDKVCPITPVEGTLRAQLSQAPPPHPNVVNALLTVSLATHDSHRTVALLEPRLQACHHESAQELFLSLRARRRVCGICTAMPEGYFPTYTRPPLCFADELRGLANVLPRVRGSLSELACLALLFVMEAETEDVASAGLSLITNRLPALSDTKENFYVHWYKTRLTKFFASRFDELSEDPEYTKWTKKGRERLILQRSIKPPFPLSDPCTFLHPHRPGDSVFEALCFEYAYPFPPRSLLSFKSNGGYVTRFIASAKTMLSLALLGKEVVETVLNSRTLLTTEHEANRILGALARVRNAYERDPSDTQVKEHFAGLSFLVARLRLQFRNAGSSGTVSVLPQYGANSLRDPERRNNWTVDNATLARVTGPECSPFTQRQFEHLTSAKYSELAALCELALQFRLGLTSFDVQDQLLAASVGVATVPTPCLMPALKKAPPSKDAWGYELLPENEKFFSLEAFPEVEWGPKWRV